MRNAEEPDRPQPAPGHGAESDARDDVYDASNDSFPASDSPPWTGIRVGGPLGRPPGRTAEPDTARYTTGGDPPPAGEPAGSLFDARWVARQWRDVHVSHAEVHAVDSRGEHEWSMLRAVVQLGDLAPADVRVTARSVVDGSESEPPSAEPLRLWSVQSHHNGAVVFEAAAAASVIDDAAEFLVTVAPARTRSGGAAPVSIVQHFTSDGNSVDQE